MNITPRRVLVVVTRRIGDVLLATPVLRSLKNAWPQAQINALVFQSSLAALSGNRDVDNVVAIPERPALAKHVALLIKIFRRYDLAVSLVAGDRPTFYAYAAGRRRVGLLLPTRKEAWKRRWLHEWAPYDMAEQHTVLTHLSVLKLLNVAPIAELAAPMQAGDEPVAANALASLNGRRFVVLHPYPKFNYKTWSTTGWVALAQWLLGKGVGVVFTGSGDATEVE